MLILNKFKNNYYLCKVLYYTYLKLWRTSIILINLPFANIYRKKITADDIAMLRVAMIIHSSLNLNNVIVLLKYNLN